VTDRQLPWSGLIKGIGEHHFVEISEGLKQTRIDDLDRDAFLLHGAVGAVLRDLMPEDAPSESINAYGALLHMLYVMWARDFPLIVTTEEQVRTALRGDYPLSHSPDFPLAAYVQLPERLVWGEPVAGDAHEPLDGVFVIATHEKVHALAILGFRIEREGFTTMEGAIALPSPPSGPRLGGDEPFTSAMPGGAEAGLISVVDETELATLVMRVIEVTAAP
jgi:hypothetical protein